MYDAVLVKVLDRPSDGSDQFCSRLAVERTVLSQFAEAAPLDVVHRKIVLAMNLAHLVDSDDVRMFDSAGRPGLGVESLHGLGGRQPVGEDHLHSHGAVEILLMCPINYPHAARAPPLQAIRTCRNRLEVRPADSALGPTTFRQRRRPAGNRLSWNLLRSVPLVPAPKPPAQGLRASLDRPENLPDLRDAPAAILRVSRSSRCNVSTYRSRSSKSLRSSS